MKTIKLNRDIFSDRAIEKAVDAYCGIAAISLEYTEEYALISFTNCEYDEALTAKEFENYVIGIENS